MISGICRAVTLLFFLAGATSVYAGTVSKQFPRQTLPERVDAISEAYSQDIPMTDWH